MLPCQRALFDIPEDITYLNCAYMGPLPRAAVSAGEVASRIKAQPWTMPSSVFFDGPERLRALFARLIHATAEDIALIPSVSYGMAVAARNLPVAKDQAIVMLAEEFPSNYYAWAKKAEQCGAEIIVLPKPADGNWTTAVLAALNARVAVASLPHCHWTDGAMLDLVTIGQRCRELGTALVVDGTQSIGALPFDVAKIQPDFLTTSGYKWLLGPYSLGYLYVSPRFQQGEALEESWVNRANARDLANLAHYTDAYQPGARRFDMGQRSHFASLPAAVAAMEQLLEWGVEHIATTLQQFTNYLADAAPSLGLTAAAHHAPHMIGLAHAALPQDILKKLVAQQIYISQRGNALRISPHVYNTREEIDRLIVALKQILR